MQFINIIVHSVEDVNFRVHLQHEFSLLGLDDYLVVCIAKICTLCTAVVYTVVIFSSTWSIFYKQ